MTFPSGTGLPKSFKFYPPGYRPPTDFYSDEDFEVYLENKRSARTGRLLTEYQRGLLATLRAERNAKKVAANAGWAALLAGCRNEGQKAIVSSLRGEWMAMHSSGNYGFGNKKVASLPEFMNYWESRVNAITGGGSLSVLPPRPPKGSTTRKIESS